MGFSAVDYAVLAAYLAGITVFGARFRRSHQTVTDYFIGARDIPWWVVSLSIVATETSTLTLVGVPAIAFASYPRPEQGGNLTYLQVVAGYVVARVLIGWLFIPAYFSGRLFTAYELIDRRFGAAAKHVTASLFLIMRPLAEGVRVFAASVVLGAVIGASLPGLSHLWLWSILIVGLLTLVYTFEGGIVAVIWTDVVQLAIYLMGSGLAAYELIHQIPGGWSTFVAEASRAGKLQALSFSTDITLPFTFWAGLIGGTFLTMASHGTDQLLVQRLLTCRNAVESRRALVVSGFVVFAQFTLFLFVGLLLFTFYRFQPLPPMATTDEIFPAFIVRSLPHGIAGLVIAAIFAAAMSNLSASLNSLASTSVMDFYLPLSGRARDDAGALRLSRWLTVAWGVVLIGIAILARGWGSVFTTGLTIASIVYGPMLGVFLLARLSSRATGAGAIAGVVVSLAVMIGIRLETPLAWTWYVMVGAVICMATGTLVSRVTGRKNR